MGPTAGQSALGSPGSLPRSGPFSTHYLATGESTDGKSGLYRVQLGARSPGAETHLHRALSESFCILSGELELYDGEEWDTGPEGDFLYMSAGGLRAFKNVTDEPMTMLMLFSPGPPREEYFERVAEVIQRGGAELEQFRARHDSYRSHPRHRALRRRLCGVAGRRLATAPPSPHPRSPPSEPLPPSSCRCRHVSGPVQRP